MDLGINDWHYVVCFQADMANIHMERIVYRTMCGTVALLVAVAVFCVFLFSLFLKMAKHIGVEERRYLLLEQFSDTVLFDYDIRRDIYPVYSQCGQAFQNSWPGAEGFPEKYGEQIYLRR